MNPKEIYKSIEAATGFKVADRVRIVDKDLHEDGGAYIVRGLALVMNTAFSFTPKLEIAGATDLPSATRAYSFRIKFVEAWQIEHWTDPALTAVQSTRTTRRRSPNETRRLFP